MLQYPPLTVMRQAFPSSLSESLSDDHRGHHYCGSLRRGGDFCSCFCCKRPVSGSFSHLSLQYSYDLRLTSYERSTVTARGRDMAVLTCYLHQICALCGRNPMCSGARGALSPRAKSAGRVPHLLTSLLRFLACLPLPRRTVHSCLPWSYGYYTALQY